MKAIDLLPKVAASDDHSVCKQRLVRAPGYERHSSKSASNSTSGEEGYDSINSDEEPLSLSVISSGRLFAKDDDDHTELGLSAAAASAAAASAADRDPEGPLSLGSSIGSSIASSVGSACGTHTFQELKVTSDLCSSATASPKRATFTIGTPRQLSAEDGDEAVACGTPRGTPRGTPCGTPCGSPRKELFPPESSSKGTDVTEATNPAVVADKDLSAGWNRTVAEVKEQAFSRLQDELRSAHQELRLRDEEVTRLSRIRDQVEAELEELTASLFQEAHNMVRDANTRQASAERSLAEARMQVEVLTAEVAALKTLVLTSTPAKPNPHLHPQIDKTKSCDDSGSSSGGLFRKHRRSPSHFNLKYGRENSPPDSPVKENQSQSAPSGSCIQPVAQDQIEPKDGIEVDPNVHKDFLAWRQCPTLEKGNAFVARVYREDIDLCLDFNNRDLAERVECAVESGNIYIEAVGDRSKTAFPKKCALLEVPRQCHYRMKLGDQDTWHSISQICRNRITAVIDFLNYLRYIERGLVKSSVHDIYWEIVRLRKEMCLARLGLSLSS